MDTPVACTTRALNSAEKCHLFGALFRGSFSYVDLICPENNFTLNPCPVFGDTHLVSAGRKFVRENISGGFAFFAF